MISTKARILEKALAVINFRKIVSKKILSFRKKRRNKKPPRLFYKKYSIKESTVDGMKSYTIFSAKNANKHILYFHGGAYSLQASKIHWKLIESMIKQTNSKVTFLDYPLVPQSCCNNTLETVKKAYKSILADEAQEIILMGDSAGGGIALALTIAISKENINPKPSKTILLSAWIDISMEGKDYSSYSDKDVILDAGTLKEIGRVYAGGLDIIDYRCSPVYGDLNDIGKIAIFTGTKDMLNIQSRELKDRLIKNGHKCAYYEYENMQHIWMLLPIPEAQDAITKICDFINSKKLE